MKTIAIFPGSFKPPHAGHYDVVKRAAQVADEVYVIGSTKTRDNISGELSKTVWEKFYIPMLDNKVKFISAPISPVKTTYDMLEDIHADVVLFVGDEDISRFKNAHKYASKDYITKVQSIPRTDIPISGTEFRSAIRSVENIDKFIPKMPQKLKEKLVTFLRNEIKQ